MRRPGAGRLALARAVGALSRLAGGGGTSAPGKVLVRLDRGAVSELSARLPEGSVLISATNGKTTTATMLAAIMRGAGTTVVHNAAGANMEGGIATALLGAAGRATRSPASSGSSRSTRPGWAGSSNSSSRG